MNLRRDPLGEHTRVWLAHFVQPDPGLHVRASGTVSHPVGCGLASLPARIGELDSQALVPSQGPVVLPTAESIARERELRVRHGAPRAHLPKHFVGPPSLIRQLEDGGFLT